MHLRGSVDFIETGYDDWRFARVKAVAPYAYVIRDKSFEVVDIADPDVPRLHGHLRLDHLPYLGFTGLAQVGSYFYLTARDSLRIVDVSAPASPRVVRTYPARVEGIAASSSRIAASGSTVYVAATDLEIFDASSPTEPVLVKSVPFPNTWGTHEVTVSGDFAYVLYHDPFSGDHLAILDVSTPATASIVGDIELPQYEGTASLDVRGNHAYIGDAWDLYFDEGMLIIDVSNPTAPKQIYFDDQPFTDAVVVGDVLCQATDYALRTIDVSTPAAPQVIGGIGIPLYPVGVDVDANFAYVVGWPGLRVVELANRATARPSATVTLATSPTTNPATNHGIVLSDERAYVAAGPFSIFDVSNPDAPSLLGATADVWALDVVKRGPFAFVANGPHGTYDVKVIDVSNPASPTVIGGIDAPAERIAASGTLACVVHESHGLHVLDISDPGSLTVLGHVDLQDGRSDVAMQGGYAYVATFGSLTERGFLLVFDLSNPAVPALVGQAEIPNQPTEVVVAGDYAYVTSRVGVTLDIVDISDPANPHVVGSTNVGPVGNSIAYAEGYCYIGTLRDLLIVDVQQPAAPKIVGNALSGIEWTGRVGGLVPIHAVAATAGFVYLSSAFGYAFEVIPAPCSTPTSVTLTSFEAHHELDGAIALTWTTSQSVRHAGFNLARSLNAEGPYERLNPLLITGSSPYRYLDDLARGSSYFYRLESIDLDGRSAFFGPVSATAAASIFPSRLGANRPNPFGAGGTAIAFELAKQGRARMTIYDVAGRRVRTIFDGALGPGRHIQWWDGRDDRGAMTAPGVYFYRLQAPGFAGSRQLVRVH
jgi:hypothetical protein